MAIQIKASSIDDFKKAQDIISTLNEDFVKKFEYAEINVFSGALELYTRFFNIEELNISMTKFESIQMESVKILKEKDNSKIDYENKYNMRLAFIWKEEYKIVLHFNDLYNPNFRLNNY
jgi:pyruvate formate-lyase activating enzyme-like uncharacterized protein